MPLTRITPINTKIYWQTMTMTSKIDIDKLLEDVDFDEFRKADLYPDIWYNEDKEDLSDELKAYFINFKQFYENALKNGRSVLIVIC